MEGSEEATVVKQDTNLEDHQHHQRKEEGTGRQVRKKAEGAGWQRRGRGRR